MSHKKISKTVITLHLPTGVESKDAKTIMDQATDRLYEIQLQKRKLEQEDEEIRERMKALMGLVGLQEHFAESGHKATMYDSRSVCWSAERLQEVLTQEEQEYCCTIKPYKAIRIS
jgi:hypothetical protein